MRIAFWKPKATNTHSEYVLIIAFILQQWLHERASLLRYTFIQVSLGFQRIKHSRISSPVAYGAVSSGK